MNTELRMPGVGLTASTEQFRNRLHYASENRWLDAVELETLSCQLKEITELEKKLQLMADADNAGARQRLSQRLYELNQRFEDMVLGTVSATILWKNAPKLSVETSAENLSENSTATTD